MNLEVLKVIKVELCEGEGTKKDLMRMVTYFYTIEGVFLFKNDPVERIKLKIEEVEE